MKAESEAGCVFDKFLPNLTVHHCSFEQEEYSQHFIRTQLTHTLHAQHLENAARISVIKCFFWHQV